MQGVRCIDKCAEKHAHWRNEFPTHTHTMSIRFASERRDAKHVLLASDAALMVTGDCNTPFQQQSCSFLPLPECRSRSFILATVSLPPLFSHLKWFFIHRIPSTVSTPTTLLLGCFMCVRCAFILRLLSNFFASLPRPSLDAHFETLKFHRFIIDLSSHAKEAATVRCFVSTSFLMYSERCSGFFASCLSTTDRRANGRKKW